MQESVLLQAYLAHEWELRRYLSQRLGCPSLAADLTHDIYLKLRRSDDLPDVRDSRAYLFGMAANLATDHLRVEQRRREIRTEADGVVWHDRDERTPERHALNQAELDYIEAAAARLTPRCRQIFYLNRYEHKSQAEIAQELGLGLTTVYKELKTAMAALVAARRRQRTMKAVGRALPDVKTRTPPWAMRYRAQPDLHRP